MKQSQILEPVIESLMQLAHGEFGESLKIYKFRPRPVKMKNKPKFYI